MITRIQGPWGHTIYEAKPEHIEAITPQNAYVMAHLLKGVVNSGTGWKARVLERPVGGKTGTTNEENDAWFIGVTPHLVTATYVGYDQLQSMGKGEGGSGSALPCYIHYAKEGLKAYPPDDFTKPETGIVDVAVNEGLTLPFYEGTEPFTGYGLSALATEGGVDEVGAALMNIGGGLPSTPEGATMTGPDGQIIPIPPEILARQQQAEERRRAEEQAQQGEDLLKEMF
jgi:penicillin-binding protein 1A